MLGIGLFIMLIGACLVAPVVVIHRCNIDPRKIWLRGISLISIGVYVAQLLLVYFPDMWPSPIMHLIHIGISVITATFATAVIYFAKRRAEKLELERREEIKITLAKFEEHGGAKRKKGPYVPSNAWGLNAKAGIGTGTPSATTDDHGHGYHGMPMP